MPVTVGTWIVTLIVVVAVLAVDLLIVGYLVFTANVFALMGLRQLYFLLGGLLDRLVHLNCGLAVVLGFIGVKVVLEALHDDGLRWVPEVPIWLSLVIIAGTLGIAAATSLLSGRTSRETSATGPRGAAADYQLGGEHEAGAGR